MFNWDYAARNVKRTYGFDVTFSIITSQKSSFQTSSYQDFVASLESSGLLKSTNADAAVVASGYVFRSETEGSRQSAEHPVMFINSFRLGLFANTIKCAVFDGYFYEVDNTAAASGINTNIFARSISLGYIYPYKDSNALSYDVRIRDNVVSLNPQLDNLVSQPSNLVQGQMYLGDQQG